MYGGFCVGCCWLLFLFFRSWMWTHYTGDQKPWTLYDEKVNETLEKSWHTGVRNYELCYGEMKETLTNNTPKKITHITIKGFLITMIVCFRPLILSPNSSYLLHASRTQFVFCVITPLFQKVVNQCGFLTVCFRPFILTSKSSC